MARAGFRRPTFLGSVFHDAAVAPRATGGAQTGAHQPQPERVVRAGSVRSVAPQPHPGRIGPARIQDLCRACKADRMHGGRRRPRRPAAPRAVALPRRAQLSRRTQGRSIGRLHGLQGSRPCPQRAFGIAPISDRERSRKIAPPMTLSDGTSATSNCCCSIIREEPASRPLRPPRSGAVALVLRPGTAGLQRRAGRSRPSFTRS
jgi:hypothetical protein